MAEGLCFWVITRRPSDFPEHIVTRRQWAGRGTIEHAPIACVYDSLDGARRDLPDGLICMPRDPRDDPVIIESWF
jgi:hypothetical protein